MKIIWITLGFLFFGLGTIGIYLPLVPTVPFYLLTSFCFSKGSDRFFIYFSSTKLYKKHLADFVAHRRLTLKRKLAILAMSHTMMAIPFIMVDLWWVRLSIALLSLWKITYFFTKIETHRPVKAKNSWESI